MKKIFMSIVAVVMMAYAPLFGQNTIGTVSYSIGVAYPHAALTLEWSENDSFIDPVFYWDTLPNLYRFSSLPVSYKSYSKTGSITHILTTNPCTFYYTKVVFKDGRTGTIQSIERWFQVPGNKKPEMTLGSFNTGFTFINFTVNPQGYCNTYAVEVWYGKYGFAKSKLPTQQYFGDAPIQIAINNLEANQNYEVEIFISNWIGTTPYTLGISTRSNLPPEIETVYANSISPREVQVTAFIDNKNTFTDWTIEYGTDLNLTQRLGWMRAFSKGDYTTSLFNLQPNTVYYWRAIGTNEFGTDEGRIRMFKTDGVLGVTQITEQDLLHIGSSRGTLRLWSDMEIPVQIMNLNGQAVYSGKISKEITDVVLTPGIYIVHSEVNGTTVSKKMLVD